jgi:hypothetical protein
MRTWLKLGGAAALLHAAAYLVGIALGVTLLFPMANAGPGQYVAFVAQNEGLVYVWNLVSYWGSGLTLVCMALALYHLLLSGAPILAETATAFGLIWATLIIGSANLMLRDSGVIAGLYAQDPSRAAALWPVLEAVENGIVSGNELVGSLWVLLISAAALRTRPLGAGVLARPFGYFGLAISAAGMLTMIPALAAAMSMVFGFAMIVWSVWLGVALLLASRSPSPQPVNLVVEGGRIA